MGQKTIIRGIVVALATVLLIGTIRVIQSKIAASSVAKDYERCLSGYKLLGSEASLKMLPDDDPNKDFALKNAKENEESCFRYYKYFKQWADTEIKPPADLIIALVLRHEPEKAKEWGWDASQTKS